MNIDPFINKLDRLKEYMSMRIDRMPSRYRTFEQWMDRYEKRRRNGNLQALKDSALYCFYCSRMFGKSKKPTRDHFMPKSRDNKSGVFVICCKTCNSAKGDIHPDEFLRRIMIAEMTGDAYLGLGGKKLRILRERVERVCKNIQNNEGPKYYLIRKKTA